MPDIYCNVYTKPHTFKVCGFLLWPALQRVYELLKKVNKFNILKYYLWIFGGLHPETCFIYI